MWSRILLVGIFIAASWSAGCGQQSAEELFAAGEAAAADPATADQAVAHFTAFLERFGQSPRAPEALRKLAGLAQQQGKMQEAIGYYERVLAEYPASEHGDEAQFMIAFIYEEHIRDLEEARRAYQRVMENYPDSELAASARHLLPNVGRAPQEWVQFQDEVAAP